MSIRVGRILAAVVLTVAASMPAYPGSPWGASYFPNVSLTTDEGETVRFFDDLIKDKIVAVNFIYTTCVDTCPLETAQLVRVQRILGDRLGKDVFFYSISIDPEHDTPEVLAEYKERFGANWTFLTGDNDDIILLRRKLGLYVEEIQDGSNNHNVNMIIGNQTTGRWMKRSPYENPHVLADQLGNWLTGWKAPPKGGDYANAPKLRNVSLGEQLFRTRCSHCHTVNGNEPPGALGPDLLGVTKKRDRNWLINWLRAPDQMLAKKDPIALELYERYDRVAMPNMRLNKQEALNLLEYLDEEGERVAKRSARRDQRVTVAVSASEPIEDVVGIMNAWVRATDAKARANAGYMTLVNVGIEDVTLVGVECDAFESVEMHEMARVDGMMKMRELRETVIPADGIIKFAPGGKHLMLIGPRQHLTEGQTVDMTLVFKSGVKQSVSIKVAAR